MSPASGRYPQLARLGLAVASALMALAGCGGSSSAGSTEGFVSSNRTITVVPMADRKPAPRLEGLDLQGKPLSSADLRGDSRILVVNVWGSWCAPCRREAPVLAAAARRYSDDDVRFLGLLSRDKPAAATAFARRFKVDYPSLQDPGGRLQLRFADSLPSQGIPTTWIIDRNGRVAVRVLAEVTAGTLDGLIDDELVRR
nr:TlpA disulfide reductase family protein [Aeromicrobium sp.]